MKTILQWIGAHHWSTYMLFLAWVACGAIAHPSVTSYLLLGMLGPWLFITREVARLEGPAQVNRVGLIGSVCTVAAVVAVIVSIRWFGL